jgi:subtilisin family serine protease
VGNVFTKAKRLLDNSGAKLEFEYDTAIKGFAVSGLVAKFLTIILNDDMVEYVEEVCIIDANTCFHVIFLIGKTFLISSAVACQDQVVSEDQLSLNIQESPNNWALDRIDNFSLPLDNEYKYLYTGKGVKIFLLDTGVNAGHREFGGRAECGYSAIDGEDCTDYRGHGSHTAGLAAGDNVGVAKNAKIISVKVLDKDGNGSLSGVLAGVNFVTGSKIANPDQPMVASKSIFDLFSCDSQVKELNSLRISCIRTRRHVAGGRT